MLPKLRPFFQRKKKTRRTRSHGPRSVSVTTRALGAGRIFLHPLIATSGMPMRLGALRSSSMAFLAFLSLVASTITANYVYQNASQRHEFAGSRNYSPYVKRHSSHLWWLHIAGRL